MYLLIITLPLFSAVGAGFGGRYLGAKGAGIMSSLGILVSALLSFLILYETLLNGSTVYLDIARWITLVNFGLQYDGITSIMLLVITVISGAVHIYSTSYMVEDPHLPRFMGYLSVFTFFMLILVTSSNYLQLFIGWEGVGLCSYLLINFWFTRIQANKAAIKAMLINRIGDIGLILAIILIWKEFGVLDYSGIFPLVHPSPSITWICVFLTIGAIGKSAQLGLHTWLPDAMEGPTPVSALIHAATMVTAGVFLIIRSAPLFDHSPIATIIIALIGSLTAFFAATVGLVQSDIKRVIAYSTCSQLGYMVMIAGTSCASALYHLLTHAFFKALLFLGAGSVIHALLDEQDVRKMGGAVVALPLTYILMLVGSLSLAGFPYLSGFYSKDLMLELTYNSYWVVSVYWLAALTAFLTALYSFKLMYLTFFINTNLVLSNTQSQEGNWGLTGPLLLLGIGSIVVGYLFKNIIFSCGIYPVPIVPTMVSLLPVLLSILGIGGALSGKISASCLYRPRMRKYYEYLFNAWGFNVIAHTYVSNLFWEFGHTVSYRVIDRGILEILGPFGLSLFFIHKAQQLSNLQSGVLYNYVLLILIGASSSVYLLSH